MGTRWSGKLFGTTRRVSLWMLDRTCCELGHLLDTAVDVDIHSMYSRDGPRPASRQEQQNDVKADEIEVDEPMEVVEVSAASEASPSRSILGFEVESKESGAEIPEDTIGR